MRRPKDCCELRKNCTSLFIFADVGKTLVTFWLAEGESSRPLAVVVFCPMCGQKLEVVLTRIDAARVRIFEFRARVAERQAAVGPKPGSDAEPGAQARWGLAMMRAVGDPLGLGSDPESLSTMARLMLDRARRGEDPEKNTQNYLDWTAECAVLIEDWPDSEDKTWLEKSIAGLKAEPKWTNDEA